MLLLTAQVVCFIIFSFTMSTSLKNRRKQFLVNKSLQFHVMGWAFVILLVVSSCIVFSLYFGVWSQALQEFSDENIQNALQFASRVQDYDAARFGQSNSEELANPRLAFIKDTERFSERQREMIQGILDRAHERLMALGLPLLILIALSTVYLSHKIAGPLYRFGKSFEELGTKNLTIRVRLRKFDEAKTLSAVFNQAVVKLDGAMGKIKKILRENQNPSLLKNELSKEISEFRTTEE